MGGAGRASPANTALRPQPSPPVSPPSAPLVDPERDAEVVPGQRFFGPPAIRRQIAQTHTGFAAWAATLSPAEVAAIATYKGVGYGFNRRLRAWQAYQALPDKPARTPEPLSADDRTLVAHLDGLVARGRIPHTLTVYRGRQRQLSLAEAQHEVGGIIADPGFVSTTLDIGVAEGFAGYIRSGPRNDPTQVTVRAGTLYAITIPAGSRGAWLDAWSSRGEFELLLPRDSQFRVTRVSQSPVYGVPGGFYTTVHLELLPAAEAPAP
jgi:hypothetical protein